MKRFAMPCLILLACGCSASDGSRGTLDGEHDALDETDAEAIAESIANYDPEVLATLNERSPGRRGELMQILRYTPDDPQASAELAELDHQGELAFGLVAEVEPGPGRIVKFFEPEPGLVWVREKHGVSESSAFVGLGPDATAQDLWAHLRGEEEMPKALAAAASREAELLANRYAPRAPVNMQQQDDEPAPDHLLDHGGLGQPLPSSPDDLIEKHAGSAVHFISDHNGCAGLTSDEIHDWCWVERSGGWKEGRSSAEVMGASLAMFSGNVMTWRNQVGDAVDTATVRPGEHWNTFGRGAFQCVPFCWVSDVKVSSEIKDAEAFVDMWHFGGAIGSNGWAGRG